VLKEGLKPSRARKATSIANDIMIEGFTEDLAAGNISVGTFLMRASTHLQGAFDLCMKFRAA